MARTSWPEAKSMVEYTETRKQPYGFEYFGLGKDLSGIPTYKDWATGVDTFIQDEILSGNLEDSLDTYDHIIKEISKSMKLHPDLSGSTKMEKIYRWITEVLRPQRDLERRKHLILGNG